MLVENESLIDNEHELVGLHSLVCELSALEQDSLMCHQTVSIYRII